MLENINIYCHSCRRRHRWWEQQDSDLEGLKE